VQMANLKMVSSKYIFCNRSYNKTNRYANGNQIYPTASGLTSCKISGIVSSSSRIVRLLAVTKLEDLELPVAVASELKRDGDVSTSPSSSGVKT
jgi:hypothetical protein